MSGGIARRVGAALTWGLAAACAAGLARDPGGEAAIHERIDLPSITACGRCHGDVYREWARSLHARAWTNANVLTATGGFARESCRPCHSPLPVLLTGLDRAPDYRPFNQTDGVHCLSCHGRADGVAAARTIEDAPCRPIEDPRLRSAEHCFPCHQPTHQAFDEYRSSSAAAVGVRCADCHMPPRHGAAGRSHGPRGGFDPDFVRSAVDWEAELEGGSLRLVLRNRTGHKFPGEISSRALLVRVEVPGEEPRTVLLRRPHRGEERADDRLRPDEVRRFTFDLPERASEVRLHLLFRSLPLQPDEEAILIGERVWTPDHF